MRKNKAGWKQNGFTMLALDDDVTITSALQAYFEGSGYQVDTESDPERALERMQAKHYDILLLDFLMHPLCGDEVVARLRVFDQDVFVILLTGHKELAPPLNTVRELDIQGYFEKSERFDQLELLVESCTKSIRQMRIIRSYRDGLSQILTASPLIHRLAPVEENMRQVLVQGQALMGTEGLFLWIAPPERIDDQAEAALDFAQGLYRGTGQYDVQHAVFAERILPGLRPVLEAAAQGEAVQNVQGYLIAPLRGMYGQVFGLLAVDALCNVSDDQLRLLDMFARQSASALSNAVLYELVQQSREEIAGAYKQLNGHYLDTISALRSLVDAKDIYTRGHSDRVSYYALRLAREIGLDEAQCERVRVAALFHDVGKVGTSELVLTKQGRLTEEEFAHIKQHPSLGARILSSIAMFKDLPTIVEAHHERVDGNGYPHGLAGESIPMEARIIAIADAFDAMTSDRHYRKSLGLDRAVEEMRKGCGKQFDEALVEAFLRVLGEGYDGICEELAWTYQNDLEGGKGA